MGGEGGGSRFSNMASSNEWNIAKYLNVKCPSQLVDQLMNEYKEGKAYRTSPVDGLLRS